MTGNSQFTIGNANPEWKIGIVHSMFYPEEMEKLVASAKDTLIEAGVSEENISIHQAAGSFEVPLIGSTLAKSKKVDALIGLGIIVQGETHHADLIAAEAARGIMEVQLQYAIPFAFEIIYVDDIETARRRLEKGREAALTSLHSLAKVRSI